MPEKVDSNVDKVDRAIQKIIHSHFGSNDVVVVSYDFVMVM